MDQLAVVTTVLVLSTLLTSLEDIKKFWRRRGGVRFGKMFQMAVNAPPEALSVNSADPPSGVESQPKADLLNAILADLESGDARRIARGMTMVDKVAVETITPHLVKMLRHPADAVSSQAARALIQLGSVEGLEPLYLYYNSRIAETVPSPV